MPRAAASDQSATRRRIPRLSARQNGLETKRRWKQSLRERNPALPPTLQPKRVEPVLVATLGSPKVQLRELRRSRIRRRTPRPEPWIAAESERTAATRTEAIAPPSHSTPASLERNRRIRRLAQPAIDSERTLNLEAVALRPHSPPMPVRPGRRPAPARRTGLANRPCRICRTAPPVAN